MGDIDDGGAELAVKLLDLGAHLNPQLGIEIGQRFVEQEDLRFTHDRASHGDALALSARELRRLALQQGLEIEHARSLADAGVDLALRHPLELERKRHVLPHRHVRVERVALEHHGDVAALGREKVDEVPVDQDLAAGGLVEAGENTQERRFSASRGPDERDEFPVGDTNVDVFQDFHQAVGLANAFEFHLCQNGISFAEFSLSSAELVFVAACNHRMSVEKTSSYTNNNSLQSRAVNPLCRSKKCLENYQSFTRPAADRMAGFSDDDWLSIGEQQRFARIL